MNTPTQFTPFRNELLPAISDDASSSVSLPIHLRLTLPEATLGTDLWGLPMWLWLLLALGLGAWLTTIVLFRGEVLRRRTHRLHLRMDGLGDLLSEAAARREAGAKAAGH